MLRQQNLIPFRLKLANKINTTRIENKKINSTVISDKNLIPYEGKKLKVATFVEINHATIQANAGIVNTSSTNFTLNNHSSLTEEHYSNDTQRMKFISPEAVWNARKFIFTTTAKKHYAANNIQDNTNESKQQSQPEKKSDTSTEPDKVHCPIVEKIQQAAQKIDDATFYNDSYIILSHNPAFLDNDIVWLIAVGSIIAGSSDEAIYMGRIALSKTNLRKKEYAEKVDRSLFQYEGSFSIFRCDYGSDFIIAVGIWDKALVDE